MIGSGFSDLSGLIPRRFVFGALIGVMTAALGVAYFVGRGHGADAIREQMREALDAAQEDVNTITLRLSEKAAEALQAREALADLQRTLEDEARADPSAPNRVPGPDSLRRLERLWGPHP